MQDLGANTMDIQLPERWAVLEQALRQINSEDAAHHCGSSTEEENLFKAEDTRRLS